MKKNFVTRHPKLFWLIIGVVIYALIPLFIHSPYFHDLFIMVIVNAILGMTFLMTLRAGLINLAIAPFFGIGAYVSTVLTMKFGISVWLSMPLSAIFTAIAGLIIGFVLMKSGGTGFGFIMLSSVIGMLFVVTVGNIRYLGGFNGIMNVPVPEISFLPSVNFATSRIPFFYLAIVIFIIVVLIANAFYSSWSGRAWTATGLSPRLAESLGVDIFRYKMLAFIVSCAILGLIGSFYAHYAMFVRPDTFGMWVNIYIQIYAILGGMGYSIFGPVIGAGVMTFFPEAFRGFQVYSPLFTGAILIILILFLPKGVLSLVDRRSWIGGHVLELVKKIQLPTRRKPKEAPMNDTP